MSIPTMILTAASVAELLGDSADPDNEVDASALVGMEFEFICNIPMGTLIPSDDDDVWLVGVVKGIVNGDGVLCRANEDGTAGAAGVPLLGSDALSLTNPLQWKIRPGRVILGGRPVRPRSWWFNARPGGTVVTLASLVPVDQAVAMPAAPGGGGSGDVTEAAVVSALGATNIGLLLVRAIDATAARGAIGAVSAADLTAAISAALNDIIGGAPEALNSFYELATAISNDPTFAADVQSQIGALQSGKVDKVAGRQLSTEDYTTPEKTKLAGIAPGATANAPDAQLRDRTTHTGQQPSGTISDFQEAVRDVVAAFIAQGLNVTVTHDDPGDTLTISASGGSGGGDPETIRDTIGAALVGLGNISINVNDAADTITITTTATQNDTDANLRNRATHTGTQPVSTIGDSTAVGRALVTAADAAAARTAISAANINHGHTSAGIVDSTAVGRAVLTAVDAAAARAAIGASTGGGEPLPIDVKLGYLGDGRPAGQPYTLNLGIPSYDIDVTYRDKVTGERIWGVSEVLDLANPGVLTITPDVIWATDRITYMATISLESDIAPPTAGTVTEVAKTVSTIDVTATGFTDDIAVDRYRFWLNGVLQAEQTSPNYQYTGLDGLTGYTCGITALDARGNQSSMVTKSITTNAPASVDFVSVGAADRETANDVQAEWAHSVADVPNGLLIAAVGVSHLDSNWGSHQDHYSPKTLSSSIDGPLTFLDGANIGPSGQYTGALLVFYKLNPTPGNHTLVTDIDATVMTQAMMGNSFLYSGVGSIGAPVIYQPNAAGNLALTVPAVPANSRAFGAGMVATSQFTGFTQSVRSQFGSNVGGRGDFITAADAAGAGSDITFASTGPNEFRVGVGVILNRKVA